MMIYVLTGSPNLRFKTQGHWTTFDKPIRVHLDRNVQKKLSNGTLKEWQRPKPVVPKPEPIKEEEKEDKKHKKSTNKGD